MQICLPTVLHFSNRRKCEHGRRSRKLKSVLKMLWDSNRRTTREWPRRLSTIRRRSTRKRCWLNKIWGWDLWISKRKKKSCRPSKNLRLMKLPKLSRKHSKIRPDSNSICSMSLKRTYIRSKQFKWKSRLRNRRLRSSEEGKFRKQEWLFNSKSKKNLSLLQRPNSRWCRWKCSRWSWSRSFRRHRRSKSRPIWNWRQQSNNVAETEA